MTVLEVIGTIGFAVSGAMTATRQRMDVFGVAALSVIAAISGGTAARPPALRASLMAAALVADPPRRQQLRSRRSQSRFAAGPTSTRDARSLTADAIGLAVFSVLGCLIALKAGPRPASR